METVATYISRGQDGEQVLRIAVTTANGRYEQATTDVSKVILGLGAGALFSNPVSGLLADAAVTLGLDKYMHGDPNANLEYAHEFNFEGSPYYQESNKLNPVDGDSFLSEGGFKSEVQHLQPSKVSRCKAPHPSDINNFNLKTG